MTNRMTRVSQNPVGFRRKSPSFGVGFHPRSTQAEVSPGSLKASEILWAPDVFRVKFDGAEAAGQSGSSHSVAASCLSVSR